MFALFCLNVSQGTDCKALDLLFSACVHTYKIDCSWWSFSLGRGWHSSDSSLRWSQNNLKSLKSQNCARETQHRICSSLVPSLSATLATCLSKCLFP